MGILPGASSPGPTIPHRWKNCVNLALFP